LERILVSSRIVGLDIGRYSVKAVVLAATFRKCELIEVAEELVIEPDDEAVTPVSQPSADDDPDAPPEDEDDDEVGLSTGALEAVARLQARGALQGDMVIASFPRDAAYVADLVLPFSSPAQIGEILAPQLDGRLPAEIDELLVDFVVGGEAKSGGHNVYAAALRPERVAAFLGALQSLSLDPRVIELEPFTALTALLRCASPPANEAVAVADIGAYSTGLIVARNGKLEHVRTIGVGGEAITNALADTFSLPVDVAREGKHREGFIDANAAPSATTAATGDDAVDTANACRNAVKPLIRQLRNSLHAHATASATSVSKLYVYGASTALPGLVPYMEASLGVEVEVLPASHHEVSGLDGFQDVSHRFMSAYALALRGVTGVAGSRFDMRTGPFAFRGSAEILRQYFGQLLAAAAVFCVCVLVLGLSHIRVQKAEARSLEAALGDMSEQVLGERLTSASMIQTRMTAGIAEQSLYPRRSAFDVFVDIANIIDDLQMDGSQIIATNIDVEMGRFLYKVEGITPSAAIIDEFQAKLLEVDCIASVSRESMSENNRGTGFRYAVRGTLACDREREEAP